MSSGQEFYKDDTDQDLIDFNLKKNRSHYPERASALDFKRSGHNDVVFDLFMELCSQLFSLYVATGPGYRCLIVIRNLTVIRNVSCFIQIKNNGWYFDQNLANVFQQNTCTLANSIVKRLLLKSKHYILRMNILHWERLLWYTFSSLTGHNLSASYGGNCLN